MDNMNNVFPSQSAQPDAALAMPHALTPPTRSAAELLAAYETSSAFFFASPTRTLHAPDVYAVMVPQAPTAVRSLADRVDDLLAESQRFGRESAMVVGAVPFDPQAPAHLVVPMTLDSAGPLRLDQAAPTQRALTAGFRMHPCPEPEGYARGVAQALGLLAREELRKVVLARMLELELSRPLDVPALLRRLAGQNPGGYVFA